MLKISHTEHHNMETEHSGKIARHYKANRKMRLLDDNVISDIPLWKDYNILIKVM